LFYLLLKPPGKLFCAAFDISRYIETNDKMIGQCFWR